jgi:uncharacterized protein
MATHMDTDDLNMDNIIHTATTYVQKHMSNFDGSHDYNHIVRVVALAKLILKGERAAASTSTSPSQSPCSNLDQATIILGALLHDLNDSKYLDQTREPIHIANLLIQWGATPYLAERIAQLCTGVSYSSEMRDGGATVARLLREIPELAVVQDADRLDALGAVGIGRCFAFGGAKGRGMWDAVAHFEEKLLRLEGLMKTGVGKEMARVRAGRVREFMRWWQEEVGEVDGGEEGL